MPKILVETTGDFEFMVPETDEYIRFRGPTVVHPTGFVESKILRGDIRIVEALVDEASDEDYLQYLKDADGNHDLATASFLSKYGVNSSVVVVDEKPTRRKRAGDN